MRLLDGTKWNHLSGGSGRPADDFGSSGSWTITQQATLDLNYGFGIAPEMLIPGYVDGGNKGRLKTVKTFMEVLIK